MRGNGKIKFIYENGEGFESTGSFRTRYKRNNN